MGLLKTIIQNPEVVLVALQILEAQKAEEREAASSTLIDGFWDELIGDRAETRVVEFVDYSCGYCANSARDLKSLGESAQAKARIVEFPILGERSWDIAKVALAVRNIAGDDAYREFHFEVFENQGRVRDGKSALKLAVEFGHRRDDLEAEAENPLIEAELNRNREIGRELGIQGTPSFVTRAKVHEGIMSLKELTEITTAQDIKK